MICSPKSTLFLHILYAMLTALGILAGFIPPIDASSYCCWGLTGWMACWYLRLGLRA